MAKDEEKVKQALFGLLKKGSQIPRNTLVYSSGSLTVDISSGVGGFLKYQLSRLAGEEGVGKSSMAYNMAHQAIAQGESVLWVDYELNFLSDRFTAEELEKIDILRFDKDAAFDLTLETVAKVTRYWMEEHASTESLFVLDSVDASITNNRNEAGIDAALYGERAKVLTNWLPFLISDLITYRSTAIFISQARDNIGNTYNPIRYSGGRSLKHNPRQFVSLRDGGQIKEKIDGEDVLVGQWTNLVWEKADDKSRMRTAQFPIRYGFGIDVPIEMIEYGVTYGVITKGGAWYSWDYDGNNYKVQGQRAFRELVLSSKPMYDYLYTTILTAALTALR